jgi:hypothetical protein
MAVFDQADGAGRGEESRQRFWIEFRSRHLATYLHSQ